MQKAENLKRNHKLFILLIKYIPYIIALLHGVNTLFSFFEIELVFISYLSGIGLIPLVLIWLISLIFDYCLYHRLPLYYILADNSLCVYDYYIGLPIGTELYFGISLLLILSTIILMLISHNKEKHKTY